MVEKVICLWKNDIYPLLNEVDSLIKKYNSISGDNISLIEERIGIPIRESCLDIKEIVEIIESIDFDSINNINADESGNIDIFAEEEIKNKYLSLSSNG